MEKPDGIVPQGILTNDVVKVELLCAKLITLSEESLLYIEKTFQADSCDSASISNVKPGGVTTGSKYNGIWKKCSCFVLTNLHKAHLCADNLLDDIHILVLLKN